MSGRLALAAALLALATPGAALAQSPFTPLPPAPPDTTATTPTTSSSNTNDGSDGGGLKSWQEILIFLGGVGLIGGIGYGIVLDARRSAPVKEGEEGHVGQPLKAKRKAQSKPVRRARARQARAARKRNR